MSVKRASKSDNRVKLTEGLINYSKSGKTNKFEWAHVIDTPFTCNIAKVLQKTRRKIKKPFVMPMPEPVKLMLKMWRKQQGNLNRGLVFPDANGKKLYNTPLVECWKWIKKNANFHEELQLYCLRHNFTSWLIMNNVPLSVIANTIGHVGTDMIKKLRTI
jgi:integrase